MTFVPVDKIPEKAPQTERAEWKPMRKVLNSFLEKNVKYARVHLDYDDYNSETSAQSAINAAARNHKLPVKAFTRNSVLFVTRTDM